MVDIHKDRLAASIESLWTSHMYSDLTVRCREEEYKVHRSILCPRAIFFAKACNGDFMVCTVIPASGKMVAKLTPTVVLGSKDWNNQDGRR